MDDEARRLTFQWIGKRLRWAREQIPLTQAELARSLDITVVTLSKAENGQRALSILSLITAANRLRTGTEYLLTGDLVAVEPELRERLVLAHPELLLPAGRPAVRQMDPADPLKIAEEEAAREELRAAMEVVSRALALPLPRRRRRASAVETPAPVQSPVGTDTADPARGCDSLPGGSKTLQPRRLEAE
jgi:transcriptional regulator with XRE-family HTH domain